MISKCLLTGLHAALVLFTCLGGIAISLPAKEPVSPSSFINDLVIKNNQRIAKSIIVKVLANEFLGTGIIINKQVHKKEQIYTIITNNHVLSAADKPVYRIQSPDGKIYPAKIYQTVKFGNNDLGILQFISNQNYQVTKIGNSSTLTVGDSVFAAGFTNEKIDDEKANSPEKMIFTKGYVSLILDKPLEAGYQLGYTNDIYKGMSGGPLLNIQGELVGINGLHKNPIWEMIELYADGSEPCKPIQDLIPRNSWAIPIKTVEKIAPKLLKIQVSNSFKKPLTAEKQTDSTILQIREKAERAKKCILPINDNI